jgi:hypothetical protein
MISHSHRCIFVHIPKCGGTSIEDIIWPAAKDRTEADLWMGFKSKYHNKYQTGGLQHLLAAQIQAEVGKDVFQRYYKFAIIRNPWDKVISQFAYMKKRQDLRDYIGMSENDSLRTYLTLIQQHSHVQWEQQYKFITDESGVLMVDFVGRFEAFEKDVNRILNTLKIGRNCLDSGIVQIPHKNKGNRSHYTSYYDDETRDMVHQLFREDIVRFGYQF